NADAATFTIVVSIDGTVTDGQVIQNAASVTSDTPDTSPSNNTSTPTSTTVKKPPTTATVVGMTTVNCTATNGVPPDAMCSFTVKVNDNQPPVFPSGCPASITTTAAASCPFATGKVVTFPTPAATDNCPGVGVVCNPPSGSTFPTGTTTVTCTATDAAGLTAQCTFTVKVFTLCLQDETSPGNFLLFNPVTRDYQFYCNGVLIASG